MKTFVAVGVLAIAAPLLADAADASGVSAASLSRLERADTLIGSEVRSSRNERVGKLEDILVDLDTGRVLYAVVAAGGVLGLGERYLSIPPGVFHRDGKRFKVDADKTKLSKAPAYSRLRDDKGQMESPSYVSSVYRYFGQTSWWHGASSSSSSGQFGNVYRLEILKGLPVRSATGRKLGNLETIMVDLHGGRIAYVVLSPDRSLNLGEYVYALPPNVLKSVPDEKGLVAGVKPNKLAAAPHLTGKKWPDLSSPTYANQIYSYYGKRPYFEDPVRLPSASGRTHATNRLYGEPARAGK